MQSCVKGPSLQLKKDHSESKEQLKQLQHELDCFLLSSRVGVPLHHAAIPRFQCSGNAKNMEGHKVNHLTITVALCCDSHPTRQQSFVYGERIWQEAQIGQKATV